ncbi:MAG TPA: hypothetical protein VG738_12970 [Chitinophagaceae bacterium]|nr:hypothetical protein [Chitinophagaceae bacterium]
MKKVTLMFLLVAIGFASFAQDYDKVKNSVLVKNYTAAQEALDKIMADPKAKDKTTGLYWTFALNSIYFANDSLYAKHPNADSLAQQALKEYEQQDTSLKALRENNIFTHDIDNLRAGGFNSAVKDFNAHNWAAAYKGFKIAQNADDFMERHKFLPAGYVDTSTILYGGYAAQNAGNIAGAVANYRKLADNHVRINESKTFENNMYAAMLDYFLKSNDQEDFKKYVPIVKSIYPEFSDQLAQMEMQNTTTNSSLTDLVAKYKQESGGNLTEAQFATYADAFAQPDHDELNKLDSATQVQVKLCAADAYSKAYKLAANKGDVQEVSLNKNSTSSSTDNADFTGIYAYDAAILYTNIYQDLADRFYALKGADASLKAKRDETEKLENKYADSVIVWATNAYNYFKGKTGLSKRELNYTKNAVQNLANIYTWKRDRAQGVNPADYDKYDALFKQFDAETDKYDNLYKQAGSNN